MARRHRISHHPEGLQGGYCDDHPQPVRRRGPPIHRPADLAEEIEIQRREMQRIIAENRLVIGENTSMQRELMAAKEEIHRLGQIVPKLQADKEARLRELTQKGLKLEAELRACEPLKIEVKQLRAEVRDLDTLREELSAHVQGLRKDITRLKAENQQLPSMRADAEQLRKQLVDARRIFEFEKKANEEQVEQRRLMESSIISMAAEIERLRRDPMSAREKRRGYGNEGYGSPETEYHGNGFDGSWGHLKQQGPPRH